RMGFLACPMGGVYLKKRCSVEGPQLPFAAPDCRSPPLFDRSPQDASLRTGQGSNYRSPKTYWMYLVFYGTFSGHKVSPGAIVWSRLQRLIGLQIIQGPSALVLFESGGRRFMPNQVATQIFRTFDWAVCKAAAITFNTIQFFNQRNPNPSVTPRWSEKRLLKSWEKTKPTLGWPRQTDSLCPACVKEARQAIIAGNQDWRDLMHEKVGEIKAQIIERDGQVWMVKDCPLHGHYEDMMAIDSKFLDWIEKQFPGRDIPAHNDEDLHKHGSSTVRYGRGSVLTVDLTNRCNMMCDPCFMDANQVGYVHELGWDEIQEILDNALRIKPRRQM